LAAIDELDKMSDDDRDGMMEAMSQQRITVNMVESGVLPAKCSVLAAANPKYGSFDPSMNIGSQLDLDSVLLSRFDLWFVMRDEPDEELDTEIATKKTKAARAGQKFKSGSTPDPDDYEDPPLKPEEFRAYVSLAKEITPVFTDEAMNAIVSEYVSLRQINEEDAPVPTTARLLEALHRLSEASARIRLSEEVTAEDVQRAIDIHHVSLESLGIDPESGELDAMRMETGESSSSHDRRKVIISIIDSLTDAESNANYEDVKEEALVLMNESQFEKTMEKLQRSGEVYEPSTGKLRTA
jgi:replicative DNA helicase Mcm